MHDLAAVAVAVLMLSCTGCVKVTTGRYVVHGRDVSTLWGPKGSGKPIEIGSTSAQSVQRKLGEPLVRYDDPATDIFEAVPKYRWIFNPWPVVLVNQARPGDPRVLVRIDYDAGIVQQYRTTTTNGPVIHGAVPAEVNRAWPDLRQHKPASFGMK